MLGVWSVYLLSSLGEDDGDDHAIEAERLAEDENEDHADEDFVLLSVGADTCVTDDADGETGSEGGETAGQTRGQVLVTIAISVVEGSGQHYIVLELGTAALFNKPYNKGGPPPSFISLIKSLIR